uniref:Putative mitotic checkpoint protein prcc n=1 Tax=Amblyomma aureolatum TaxID=187763 RepID=A0A1E1XFS8_9ACAR
MSLVAYGDSDDSEDDSSQDVASDKITENASDPAKEERSASNQNVVFSAVKDSEELADSQRLFARLPPPKQSASTLHDPSLQDVVMKPADKSSKFKRAQLLIPSLNQFDDEEEEEEGSKRKKFRPAQTGSGLIGMLPAPKHGSITQKQLTPQVVARPPAPKPVPKRPPPKPQAPAVPPQTSHAWDHDVDDDADASEETPNFFTFDEPPLPKVSVDLELDATVPPAPATSVAPVPPSPLSMSSEPEHAFGMEAGPAVQPVAVESRKGKIVFAEPEDRGSSILDVELDDGALVRLRGKRQEEINIIDVCADNQIDKSQILIRGLTEQPTYSSHKETSDFNTSQQHRRKHQITYLAQQAKAREQDLKNSWAQNRMTRRQTQAKYGF